MMSAASIKIFNGRENMRRVSSCHPHNLPIEPLSHCHQWRTEGGGLGVQTPPRKYEDPPKSCQTQPDLWKMLKIAEFRTPTPQDVQKKGRKF